MKKERNRKCPVTSTGPFIYLCRSDFTSVYCVPFLLFASHFKDVSPIMMTFDDHHPHDDIYTA